MRRAWVLFLNSAGRCCGNPIGSRLLIHRPLQQFSRNTYRQFSQQCWQSFGIPWEKTDRIPVDIVGATAAAATGALEDLAQCLIPVRKMTHPAKRLARPLDSLAAQFKLLTTSSATTRAWTKLISRAYFAQQIAPRLKTIYIKSSRTLHCSIPKEDMERLIRGEVENPIIVDIVSSWNSELEHLQPRLCTAGGRRPFD